MDTCIWRRHKGEWSEGRGVFQSCSKDVWKIKASYSPIRTCESVKKRAKKLLKECLSFVTHVAKIQSNQTSDTTYDVAIHLATALYNNMEIPSVEQEYEPAFKQLSCWNLLKAQPKLALVHKPPTKLDSTDFNQPQQESEDDANSSNVE